MQEGRRPRGGRAARTRARELSEGARLLRRRARRASLFRLGVCRYMLSSISTAVALLDEALDARRALAACRATCFAPTSSTGAPAATAASATSRPRARTSSARSSSPRASTTGARWAISTSRLRSSPSARATGCSPATTPSARRAQYKELDDRANVGRLLNNLGGLNFLLGKPEEAIRHLKARSRSPSRSTRQRMPRHAMTSLARCTSAPATGTLAEEQARQALRLLEGRVDLLDEIGNAQLVLGRSLLEQERLDEAEASSAPPTQASTSSPRSATAPRRGWPRATSLRAAGTNAARLGCTAWLPKRSRTFGSRHRKEERDEDSSAVRRSVSVSRLRLVGRPACKRRQLGRRRASSPRG